MISAHGELPDTDTCLKLMDKYKTAWTNSLEIALVEFDVAIDDAIANGCEEIFEMINLLRLRMELNLFLSNETNYGDTWRELAHRLIQWRVDGPSNKVISSYEEMTNPHMNHLNMSREISILLMTYLQQKHNYETNIYSQLNPTSDTLCNAFYILGNVILNQMQVKLLFITYTV